MTLDGRGLTMENLEALSKMIHTDEEAKHVKLFLQVLHKIEVDLFCTCCLLLNPLQDFD